MPDVTYSHVLRLFDLLVDSPQILFEEWSLSMRNQYYFNTYVCHWYLFLETVFVPSERRRIFRTGTPITYVIMDDLRDMENPRNVYFPTEQFPNRYLERILDREIPYSVEPQVLTDLIAAGYKPKYPSNTFTSDPVLVPTQIGMFFNCQLSLVSIYNCFSN